MNTFFNTIRKTNIYLQIIILACAVLIVWSCNKDKIIDNPSNTISKIPTSGIVYIYDGCVWAMNTDGSNKTKLTSDNGFLYSISSSSNGSKFIFYQKFVGLVLLDENGEKVINASNSDDFAAITWSRNDKLYFSKILRNSNDNSAIGIYIFSMNDDGSEITQITPYYTSPDLITDHDPEDDEPSLSPDNSSLLFTTQRSGNAGVLAKMNLLTGSISFLTYAGGLNTSHTMGLYAVSNPSFSPDGLQIVIDGYIDNTLPTAEQDRSQIFIMNADGSSQYSLTHKTTENCHFPSWSPDGKYIVYENDSIGFTEPKICIMNADGSNEKILAYGSNPCFIGQPR